MVKENESKTLIEVLKILLINYKRFMFKVRKPILIRRANKWARLTGHKYLVIYYHGRVILAKKKNLKQLIKKRRFRKGTTIQMLEKNAIYVTP